MPAEESRRLITTIERAADVLTHFTQSDRADLGVTEIANELGLSKAVVHRVLITLVAKGFVEVEEESRRYRLGPMALALGAHYVDQIDTRTLALPRLRELSENTNETATLSIRYGWERMYIDQVTPDREVKMTVALGRRFPLHAGSSSKVFLALLPVEEQERYLATSPLDKMTDRTITDVTTLKRELGEIRERGYATSSGERQAGAGSVAAPLLNHRGEPTAAVSVCGPLERFQEDLDRTIKSLLTATDELSRQLGYQTARST